MRLRHLIDRYILNVRHEDLPWAQDAWNAIQNGGPLCIEEDNLVEQYHLDPRTRPEARMLYNDLILIVYLKSYAGRELTELRETLEMLIISPKRGGILVRFTDGRAVNWNRSDAHNEFPVPVREKFWYAKVLEAVRNCEISPHS